MTVTPECGVFPVETTADGAGIGRLPPGPQSYDTVLGAAAEAAGGGGRIGGPCTPPCPDGHPDGAAATGGCIRRGPGLATWSAGGVRHRFGHRFAVADRCPLPLVVHARFPHFLADRSAAEDVRLDRAVVDLQSRRHAREHACGRRSRPCRATGLRPGTRCCIPAREPLR